MSSLNNSQGTSEQSFMRLKTSHDLCSSLMPQRSSSLLSFWSLHFSPLASLLYFLPVPCAWNTLPGKLYGFLLPFFRSLPKCHLIRETLLDHTIQNSNPYPFQLPPILPDDITYGKVSLEQWFSKLILDQQHQHHLGPCPDLLSQKLGLDPAICLNSSTVMILKFKNQCSGLYKFCIT